VHSSCRGLQVGYGYNPHILQPQAMMHPQMAANISPRVMPNMMPAGAPHLDLHRNSLTSKGSMHQESKDPSEKSLGNDSQKAAKKADGHRSAKPPTSGGKHIRQNLPRPTSRSGSKPHAPYSPFQGMGPGSGADLVAGASPSKAYRSLQPPRSNGSSRR
jgi:hypothetical protein